MPITENKCTSPFTEICPKYKDDRCCNNCTDQCYDRCEQYCDPQVDLAFRKVFGYIEY